MRNAILGNNLKLLKWLKNTRDKSIFFDKCDLSFVTRRHNFEIQNALVSIRRTILCRKVVNRYKISNINLAPVPDEDKTFTLDLRIL